MIDIAKLDAEAAQADRPQCKTCSALAELDVKNADYLRGMLADRNKSGAHVAKVLTAAGFPISRSSIQHHRAEHE